MLVAARLVAFIRHDISQRAEATSRRQAPASLASQPANQPASQAKLAFPNACVPWPAKTGQAACLHIALLTHDDPTAFM